MDKRKYTKKRRAEQQDQTRERIVEATVALHEELGPAQTTVKAIAERAGVQRLTVYRHFPDDVSLFQACTSHYLAQHPPPALTEWAEVAEGAQRCRAALLSFYHYYRRTAGMWQVAYQDLDKVPALAGPMAGFEAYLDQVRDDLLTVWQVEKKRKKFLSITLRHSLRFSTWLSLEEDKLSDKDKVTLIENWLRCIGQKE